MNLFSTEALVGITISIGTVLWGIYKKKIQPYIKAKKDKRDEVHSMIGNIHKELTFNGGSSIKDAVVRIETRLGNIEENHKLSLNIQKIPFWYSNEDGECVYASPELVRVVGHSESDILGNGWAGWIIPEHRERIYDAWEFSVVNSSVFDEYYTFKRADGKRQNVYGLAFHKIVDGIHSGTMGKLEAIGNPY